MTDETRLAFAHPEARAKATASGQMCDRLSLRDHIVDVEIGAFQAERNMTQRISFNVVVEVRHAEDQLNDDVDRILSYDRVTEAIAAELAAERFNLLETLAENVAVRILQEPQACRVFVRIEKLDRGAGRLGVEIMRAPEDVTPQQDTEERADQGPAPRVLYLSAEAMASENLHGWIDQAISLAAPLLICVGFDPAKRPRVSGDEAQMRIDLLEIEQTAWQLAALDPRCVVVQTRTELDWAIKNGQVSVWAPSKILLDQVDAPRELAGSAPQLAAWFAQELAACEMIVIGDAVSDGKSLKIRSYSVAERELV